jgi:hypothetical protein
MCCQRTKMQKHLGEVKNHGSAGYLPVESCTDSRHVCSSHIQSLALTKKLPSNVARTGVAANLPDDVQNTESGKGSLFEG